MNENLKIPLLSNSHLKMFNLDDCLKIINDKGIYQITTLIKLSFLWGFVPVITVLLPFFTIEPIIFCSSLSINNQCIYDNKCNDNLKSSNNSFSTWIIDFELYCDNKYLIYLSGSIYFLGMIFSNIIIPSICNNYGRKTVLQSVIIIYIINNSMIMFIQWNKFLLIYSLISGVCYTGISIPAFILNYEYTTIKSKNIFSSILNASFPIGALLQIAVFYFFKSWKICLLIGLLIYILILSSSDKILESPSYLMQSNKLNELLKNLHLIASINKTDKNLNEYLSEFQFNVDTNNKSSTSIIELFRNYKSFSKLLLIGISWFSYSIIAYGTLFNLKSYGNNIFINGLSAYSAGVISILLSSFVLNKFGSNNSEIIYYSLAMISNFLMYILDSNHNLMYILLFCSAFCTNALGSINYIYTADLFPSNIRVNAISFGSMLNRIAGMISPLVIKYNEFPTLIFSSLAFISIIGMIILKLINN